MHGIARQRRGAGRRYTVVCGLLEGVGQPNTAIGRIGIGVCAENYYCQLPTQLIKRSADIILMPHSAPDMSGSGGLPQPPGTRLASWYTRKLGIPVAMVNKVGRSYKPPPNEINAFFPGLSVIVDSDGTVKRSMDDKEGVAVADVVWIATDAQIPLPSSFGEKRPA